MVLYIICTKVSLICGNNQMRVKAVDIIAVQMIGLTDNVCRREAYRQIIVIMCGNTTALNS